jgi:hypothetical protein
VFEVGKSLLLNRLLGGNMALVGDLLPTTPFPVSYEWGERSGVILFGPNGAISCEFPTVEAFVEFLEQKRATSGGREELGRHAEAFVHLQRCELQRVTLIDMPGFDDPEAIRNASASRMLKTLDFAIFVTRNKELPQPPQPELQILRAIKDAGIPCLMVINCFPDPAPAPTHFKNGDIAEGNLAKVKNLSLEGLAYLPQSASKAADFLRVNVEWLEDTSVDEPGSETEKQQNRAAFNDLRWFIFPDSESLIGLNAPCLGTFYRSLNEWRSSAVEQVERMLSTLNKKE